MGHTYSNVMCHVVFSTKNRKPMLDSAAMPELARVVGGILRRRGGKLLAMNGTENHVHLLAVFPPKLSISDHVRDIKAVSSGWMHEKFLRADGFAWQIGYSVFSVSKSNASAVERYIAGQAEHHRRRSFEQELIALLKKHGLEYDTKYVFD